MKRRRQALRTTILSNEAFLTVNSLMSQKDNIEQFRELAAKITNLSNKKKDFVTEAFINLAKLDYRSRFLRWYANNKVDVETPEGLEKARQLEVCIEQANLTKLKITEFVMADGETKGGGT